MDPIVLWVAVAAVFAGAATQRLSGMGFSLVSAPFLIAALGPINGVTVANVCGALAALTIMVRVIKHVQWRRFVLLTAGALIGIAPGALLVVWAPSAVLETSIGGLLLIAIIVQLTLGRRQIAARPGIDIAIGAVSGLMNVTAGVGGPAVSTYALASRWDLSRFAATMQPYFFTIGTLSLTAKYALGGTTASGLGAGGWIAIAAACLLGLVLGEISMRFVSVRVVRTVLIVVAAIGAIVTLIRGLINLVG